MSSVEQERSPLPILPLLHFQRQETKHARQYEISLYFWFTFPEQSRWWNILLFLIIKNSLLLQKLYFPLHARKSPLVLPCSKVVLWPALGSHHALMLVWTPCFQYLQSTPVLLYILFSSWTGSKPKLFNLFSDSALVQPVPLSPDLHTDAQSHSALTPHWLYVTWGPCTLLFPLPSWLCPWVTARTVSPPAASGWSIAVA